MALGVAVRPPVLPRPWVRLDREGVAWSRWARGDGQQVPWEQIAAVDVRRSQSRSGRPRSSRRLRFLALHLHLSDGSTRRLTGFAYACAYRAVADWLAHARRMGWIDGVELGERALDPPEVDSSGHGVRRDHLAPPVGSP